MMILLALLPIIWLVVALAIIKVPAWKACLVAAIMAFIIAVFPFDKNPGVMATGALEGVALAVWPILLVITAAIFAYNLVVHTGAMEKIKAMLASVTSDKRVLAVLLAWGFGAFMEGMAGFGTAVAIPAAMMVGLGFDPLRSILACLVANSVPTTFGSIAIPTTTLASLNNLDPGLLGSGIAEQLFILNVITPLFIVFIIGGGLKALKGVFWLTVASGFALAVPELLINRIVGPELSVIASSIVIMAVIIILSKLIGPKDPAYQFDAGDVPKISGKEGLIATIPFILIFVLLLGTSKLVPFIYGPLSAIKTAVPIYIGPNAKPYTFVWIATPGIMIFISAFIGSLIQGAKVSEIFSVLGKTFNGLKFTYITIISVVMTAKLMTYSGMTSEIARGLVDATGNMYPLFAPIVGALGAFLTGSGTNANVLFGSLQIDAAKALIAGAGPGAEEHRVALEYWLAAMNSGAAGIGKMFSPQSIAIAIGAVAPAVEEYIAHNKVSEERQAEMRRGVQASVIMQGISKYFVLYIIAAGLICYFGKDLIM